VAFIDITSLSRTIDTHPAFIAEDGLHPSGQQYKAWIDEIVPFFINQKNE
jgi:lysophospholipase L1-like esterase